jgi:hypothetical protein
LDVEPLARPSLMTVLAALKPIEEAFPLVESLAAEAVEI